MNKQEKLTAFILSIGTLLSLFIYLTLYSKNRFKEFYTNQRICVINAGVEIEKNFKKQYLKNRVNIGDFNLINIDEISNYPDDWNNIVNKINTYYNDYDAFLILTKRDVIPYTASALSFMLENISKPVVINDKNFLDSLLITSKCSYPEVMVISYKKDKNKKKIPILLRGCRTIQYSSDSFISPNYAPLTSKNCLKKPTDNFSIKLFDPKVKIVIVKLYPGFPTENILKIANKDVDGVIIEKYNDICLDNLEPEIQELAKKDIIIVSVDQRPRTVLDKNTDTKIEQDVIDGKDITTEAAYAKLYYILSNVEDTNLIPKIFDTNFRGEITDM